MTEGIPPEGANTHSSGRSRRRKARKRRAGDGLPGALSDGSLEERLTKMITAVAGASLLVGQIIATWVIMPTVLTRTLSLILLIAVLSAVVVWLDLLRSKKRSPRPRWLRGVLISAFLCFAVAIGSLVVLSMSANPIEDGSFSGADAGPGAFTTQSHFDIKMQELKFAAIQILAAGVGMALLAHVFTSEHRRRSDGGRARAVASSSS